MGERAYVVEGELGEHQNVNDAGGGAIAFARHVRQLLC
jgi:hypothetical protein